MSRTISIGVFFLVLIMVFLLYHMRGEKIEIYSNEFSRKFSSSAVRLKSKIAYEGDLNDAKLFNGDLCFKRFDNQTIVCVDSTGKRVGTWGMLNDSESRFSFIIHWTLDSSSLTVVDGKMGKVFYLSHDDRLLGEQTLEDKAIRATKIGENNLVIKTPDPLDRNNEIFKRVNLTENYSAALNFNLPAVEHSDFTLDGYFVSNDEINFHVCNKTGLFFTFNNQGNFLYQAKTIDETGLPEILISAEGAKRYHPLTQRINRSAFATNEKLFILSGRKATNDVPGGDIIDCYASESGQYLESIVVPYSNKEAAYDIFGTANQLFVTYPQYIIQYTYEERE